MASGVSQRSLEVEAGLYVLRYLGSADVRTAPEAHVTAAQDNEDAVTIVSAPGHPPATLVHPGSSLVVVVNRRSRVDISLEPSPGSSNLDAKFSLDLLALAIPLLHSPVDAMGARRGSGPSEQRRDATLRIKAHVSRRGDVEVEADEWVAGPQAPGSIEGISFECAGPDVGIATQIVDSRGRWSAWQPPGGFIGTRQRATPVLGLRLKLSGTDKANFILEAEALFLGSPIDRRTGTELELLSSSGTDPLIGLKVRLIAVMSVQPESVAASKSRVRVFR